MSAQVFRTCNASRTLQEQLKSTPGMVWSCYAAWMTHYSLVDGTVEEKMLAYNRANREVAILCNHQV